MLEKKPPHSLDAEQAVLGALLMDPDAVNRVVTFLRSDDFYHPGHSAIYQAVLQLIDEQKPVDLLTVTERLRLDGLLERLGGAAYVASLLDVVPTSANVEYYARIVEEKALLRALIRVSTRIAEMGYENAEAPERLLEQAGQMIMELSSGRETTVLASIRDILMSTWAHIEAVYESKGQVTGIPTGFEDLDRKISGLQPSDLIILAARPSMGKTALALSVAFKVAHRQRKPVAVFSLEMSKEQLVQRLLCSEAKVDQYRLRTGNLREEDWERLTDAAARLNDLPIFIDDTAACTVSEIRAKAKRLQAERGLCLIVIDYIQLMQAARRTESRQQEIAHISRSLKGLAKELNVPVLALSQLSRAVEQRQDKRPIMSDLRESGSLEQDADIVMFIYRDEYYNEKTEQKGVAEVIVAKHRNGPTGKVELGFFKEFTLFTGFTRREE
ncbi:replicative DNA helicase [Desulforudis sp. DRI-14]|uniref:replicative DNA helicase n=1 Tax=Desulforudis sp. DRI-14 TaxID=3459793 RepID=UPI00404323B4